MRPVSELYGRHSGEDIYVVGTGASLRVFPMSFLEGKITIGLNMAWRSAPIRYGLTIHPDLNVPEFMGETRPEITWVTPSEKTRALVTTEQFAYADDNFFYFDYQGRVNTQPPDEPNDSGRIIDWVREPSGDSLYVWSSIAQTGANLAANLGARNVILVGCDNGPMGGNDHADGQHTRWKGSSPYHRYEQYYEGMAEVRGVLRERGINVFSLQPFLGVAHLDRDFERLCKELGRPVLLESVDISPKITLRERVVSYVKRKFMPAKIM